MHERRHMHNYDSVLTHLRFFSPALGQDMTQHTVGVLRHRGWEGWWWRRWGCFSPLLSPDQFEMLMREIALHRSLLFAFVKARRMICRGIRRGGALLVIANF